MTVGDCGACGGGFSKVSQHHYGCSNARNRGTCGNLLTILDSQKGALRRLVFADAAARSRLEAALHPLIGAEAGRRIEQWSGPYGLIVVPLLLERRGVRSIVDRVLVVDCPEEEQVRRVVARNALSPAEVHAIMATQLDRRQRLVAADDILDNTGTPDAIAPQVLVLDARYRRLAAAGSD